MRLRFRSANDTHQLQHHLPPEFAMQMKLVRRRLESDTKAIFPKGFDFKTTVGSQKHKCKRKDVRLVFFFFFPCVTAVALAHFGSHPGTFAAAPSCTRRQ